MSDAYPRFGCGNGPQIPFNSLIGAALVIRPTGTRDVVNQYGPYPAVEADMYVIDGEHANTLESGRLFGSPIISAALTDTLTTGGVVGARLKRGVRWINGVSFLYLSPLNLLTDRELLVQAEVVAKAQGWLA